MKCDYIIEDGRGPDGHPPERNHELYLQNGRKALPATLVQLNLLYPYSSTAITHIRSSIDMRTMSTRL